MSTPQLGDARRPFRCHYSGAIGQNSQSHVISTREAACRKLLAAVATGGAEVLVCYALNSIELTNQFLRFPRPEPKGRSTVNDDRRARHSHVAVTWQIANEFIFSGLLEQKSLRAISPAFARKRKPKAGKNRPGSVSAPLLSRTSVTARPAATRTFAGAYLNSAETILTSAGFVALEGPSAEIACSRSPP